MTTPVLSVRGLSVRFLMPGGHRIAAVTDAHFDVAAGECLALIGESGCGKSVLASALLGLLPTNAQAAGRACLGDLDLLAAGERTLARTVRGRLIGLIPQSPAAHLTPVRTVRSQLEETTRALTDVRGRAAVRQAAEASAERAAFPTDHLDRHPHELSGGLAQRAATTLALVGDAPLLLADEPTTGLDRDLVDHTVDELRRHVDTGDRALLIITHDLSAAERIADRVAVMYAGRIVELTDAKAFFGTPGPRHPYSRGLLQALPDRAFTPIPGMPPELGDLPDGCAFAPRCERATDACTALPRRSTASPATTLTYRRTSVLELHDITAGYDRHAPVVRNATLALAPGESVGLLGPSGCGKSTLARVAALLHRPGSGTVLLDGELVRGWRHRAPRAQRTAIGVVFQQPRLSADPRLRLTDLIAEPLRATGRAAEIPDRLAELAPAVGLTPDLLDRRPHEVSDGQLQRACLARALVLRPRWLICDEMTAMLDASTTAALVKAVEDYRAATGAGLLAVGHDQVLLDRWCGRLLHWEAVAAQAVQAPL